MEHKPQSPVEEKFLEALLGRPLFAKATVRETPAGWIATRPGSDMLVVVLPQAPIGPYWADVGIMVWKKGTDLYAQVAVELDGHDFHEKTKAQVARDKKRDRYFVSQRVTVLRFSGSEVHKNAEACADEAIACLLTRHPERGPYVPGRKK